MLGKHKLNTQALLSLSILVLIGLVIAGYFLFSNSNQSANHTYTPEMVFADSNKGQVSLASSDGKQISAAAYPKFSYLSYQAVAPNGGILANINPGTDAESFIFTRDNAIKTFTGVPANLLHSAVLVQTSHQIFFIDEKTVLFITCPDVNTSCMLQKLNLSSGVASKVLDTGVKQANSYFPSVYLVGYNASKHLAYMRVMNHVNKLGKLTNAIYEVDITSAKVVRSFSFPVSANFTTVLSPDGNKIAYTISDAKAKITIAVLNLDTKKTQNISWDKGPLLTGPGALEWSSDSSKLLTRTINLNISAGKAQIPTVIAYIDLSDNTIHIVRQINDPTLETVYGLGWLSNDQIAYQIKKSTTANSLAGATNQTVKQAIGGGSATPFTVPTGDLAGTVSY